jgi:transcriptional regulator with XRE-family HTH domain
MATKPRTHKPRPKQAAHLLALRKQAGLTQHELARAVGVPQTTIAHWEWSASPPRADVLPRLATALGVSVEDILAAAQPARLAPRPGPVSEVQRAFERVRGLPRTQQRKIVETVHALIDRFEKSAENSA